MSMRNFTLAIAGATMLGLVAAQAAVPAMKGNQPGAGIHHQPTAHHMLADGEGSGADVAANRHMA
jgi:hypothetical protein